jgi:uncharacterized protein YdeI (BOF family)
MTMIRYGIKLSYTKMNDNQYSTREAKQLGDEVMILIEGAIILTQIQSDTWPIKTAKRTCVRLLSK